MTMHRYNRIAQIARAAHHTANKRGEFVGHGVADSVGDIDGGCSVLYGCLKQLAEESGVGATGILGG